MPSFVSEPAVVNVPFVWSWPFVSTDTEVPDWIVKLLDVVTVVEAATFLTAELVRTSKLYVPGAIAWPEGACADAP